MTMASTTLTTSVMTTNEKAAYGRERQGATGLPLAAFSRGEAVGVSRAAGASSYKSAVDPPCLPGHGRACQMRGARCRSKAPCRTSSPPPPGLGAKRRAWRGSTGTLLSSAWDRGALHLLA
jgi:hypothetical protein